MQTVRTQIRSNKMLGLILILTVWHWWYSWCFPQIVDFVKSKKHGKLPSRQRVKHTCTAIYLTREAKIFAWAMHISTLCLGTVKVFGKTVQPHLSLLKLHMRTCILVIKSSGQSSFCRFHQQVQIKVITVFVCCLFHLNFEPSCRIYSVLRTLIKNALQKNNVLIFQPKHMLCVFKRTVSMRRFFWAPKTYAINYG